MAGQDVEWDEVQGIVLSAYWAKPYTRYFLLNVTQNHEKEAVAWLRELIGETEAYEAGRPGPWATQTGPWLSFNDDRSPEGPSINIAFTKSGLLKFGLTPDALKTFPWDFRDGMTSPLRTKLLADRGDNDASNWEWGGNGAEPDLLVMLYASEQEIVGLARAFEAGWGNIFHEVDRRHHPHQCPPEGHLEQDKLLACPKIGYRPSSDDSDDRLMREHFGFADGLSQPAIETSPRSRKFRERGDFDAIVRSGEFILGYVNERGQLPVSPSIDQEPGTGLPVITYADRSLATRQPLKQLKPGVVANLLKRVLKDNIWQSLFKPQDPAPWIDNRRLDFGRNGTFLVYRQLQQDVFAFDALIQNASRQRGYDTPYRLSDEADVRRTLAAKMIGRWDDGTPLTLEPRAPLDKRGSLRAVNNFGFADEDAHGLRCPIGAHIRRANPRDTLDTDPKHAMRRNNRHRLLRRGRLYGKKTGWTAWDDHKRDADGRTPSDNAERGLHFVCINASIESQFEFIQQTWMNTSFFGGLKNEFDPLIGGSDEPEGSFTIQGAPIDRRIQWRRSEIGPLVKVKGGAYFFLPSRKALDYLAKDPKGKPAVA
jgi:deferrochelatase/peroxidase EfeB